MLRTPKCDKVNLNDFSDNEKSRSPTADILGQVNVMNALSTGCEMLDRVARQCRKRVNQHERNWDEEQPRWERILKTDDPKLLWKSIDWSGKVNEHENV